MMSSGSTGYVASVLPGARRWMRAIRGWRHKARGGVLPHEPVHGRLESVEFVGTPRQMFRTRRTGYALDNSVRQHTPESRTDVVCRALLYSKVMRKVIGFDVFNVNAFRGVNYCWHGRSSFVPECVLWGYGELPLAGDQCTGTGTASGEGQSSTIILAYEKVYPMASEKKS